MEVRLVKAKNQMAWTDKKAVAEADKYLKAQGFTWAQRRRWSRENKLTLGNIVCLLRMNHIIDASEPDPYSLSPERLEATYTTAQAKMEAAPTPMILMPGFEAHKAPVYDKHNPPPCPSCGLGMAWGGTWTCGVGGQPEKQHRVNEWACVPCGSRLTTPVAID